jgi:hypothetical protein
MKLKDNISFASQSVTHWGRKADATVVIPRTRHNVARSVQIAPRKVHVTSRCLRRSSRRLPVNSGLSI